VGENGERQRALEDLRLQRGRRRGRCPALKSLDHADVVLYAGSFSKVLFPGLRLGYLVAPARLVQRFSEAAPLFSAGCGRLEQAVVARFMKALTHPQKRAL
jgi:DNA-binding transcriptional MocR family regulator